MEYIDLYVILHVALYATFCFSLCGYMWFVTWSFCDKMSGGSFLAIVMPTAAAVAAVLLAWAIGDIALLDKSVTACVCDAVIYIGSAALAGWLSIKRYIEENCKPEFGTLSVVLALTGLIMVLNVAFMFFI